MALFTTALGLYGGVLWSGELQGFIIHERVPTIEVLVPDASRGGRAERKFGLPTAGTWSAKMRKTALQ